MSTLAQKTRSALTWQDIVFLIASIVSIVLLSVTVWNNKIPKAEEESVPLQQREWGGLIIGNASSELYSTQRLNQYLDTVFFDMSMCNMDIQDMEHLVQRLINTCVVEELILNLSICDVEKSREDKMWYPHSLKRMVDATSALTLYGEDLFIPPWYAAMSKENDIFQKGMGSQEQLARDVENIGTLRDYLNKEKYVCFAATQQQKRELTGMEEYLSGVRNIKQLCEQSGVNMTVVCTPVYAQQLERYFQSDVAAFYRQLAEITDYWDFSKSPLSFDPRYFYDEVRPRSSVREMMLARIFGDTGVYVPSNFGMYVTKDTVDELQWLHWASELSEESTYTAQLPILMYHHVSSEDGVGDTIGAERFASHMEALCAQGYTSISFQDAKKYVETGTDLPDKPVLITFDDGYESNLTLAAPILEKYGMEATVFAVGVSINKGTYKETGKQMLPHFALEDAIGIPAIEVQSHGYDLHEVRGLDPEPVRRGALQRENESREEYIRFLEDDCERMKKLFLAAYGRQPEVLAYPYGLYSEISEQVISEHGVYATVTTRSGSNVITKGLPQSLRAMNRYTVRGEMTAAELLSLLEKNV